MATSKSTELAVVENFALSPAAVAELEQAIKEEIGVMGALDLPRTNVPSGGTLIWPIKATADDKRPLLVEALEGVIIHHHPAYAYYSNPSPTAGMRPDCSSRNGEYGITTEGGEMVSCATCPYNQFGSGTRADGSPSRGKACKNAWMLYLLREGELLPTMVKIPPTGVKALKSYIQGLLLPKGGGPLRRPYEVVTRITLNPASNSDGTDYGVPAFAAAGLLKPEVAESLKKYGESFAGVAPVAEPIGADDGDVF